ncbi:MAG TPA: FhaA domain-containing protein [Mycobacterium sp.]|nr:FhaA domain-containing protein [Mycobacterium sp.]
MDSQRGLVQRIERRLESAVDDAFARVFGGAIVPEELEAALCREAAAGVRSLEGNRLLAPNEYVITLSVHDYKNVDADPDLTADAFATHLAAYIGEQGWQTYGDVVIRFQQSPNLHTGQVRARGAVNPDASPRPTVRDSVPPQSDRAFTAEPGVPPMTDNPSYRGGHGPDRPGDDYYDARHGQHQQDDARAGQEPRGPYPPEPDPYPEQRGYPDQGQGGYPPPPRHSEQGGYPDQGQGGYPPSYEQRPPAGYGGPPGYDPGYRQPPSGYGPPGGAAQPGYTDYGRPPARHDDYAQQEQRPSYPEQGGYDQSAPPYGGQDYGQPDYGRYGEAPGSQGGYDYGQPPAAGGGYAGYGQRGYSAPAMVTLQLDDGSGRTYQLHEGTNVVGRGQDAEFRLPDTGVSRRHLEIRWDGRVARLSDLNSTNGTTVNNAPVQEWQLADGDVIRVGHSQIVVRVH